MYEEQINLQNEARNFYIKEDRKRERRQRAWLVARWVGLAGGIAWLCWTALHG